MNLADMSNEQREEHKIRVSKQIGLDPALGLLDYFWIPQENGFNSLVLYAKRGAAEILRDKHDVHVTVLTRQDGPGFVCFTAEGVNKAGRPEIAIGSASIDGLKGEKLASAVMTASTRALRRLTMQFAGCGVLDESEVYGVPAQTTAPAASNAQLAGNGVVMPPPQVVPNTEVGKDITEIYAEGKAALAAMPVPSQVNPVVPEQAFDAGGPPNVAEPRKRRGRKPNNSKDISSPGQEPVQVEIPAGQIDAQGVITPVSPIAVIPESQPLTTSTIVVPAAEAPAPLPVVTPQPISVAPPATQPNKVDSLTEVEKTAYLSKWKEYAQNILPAQGRMMPIDSVGGPTMQLRRFVQVTQGVQVTELSKEQWDDLFGFMDSYLAKSGAPALVEYIQKAIQGK